MSNFLPNTETAPEDIRQVNPMPTNRLKIHIGSDSDIGGNPSQQDSYFILELNGATLIGMLDGHDPMYGGLASRTVKQFMEKFFTDNLMRLIEFPKEVLAEAFQLSHNAIRDAIKKSLEERGFNSVRIHKDGYIIYRHNINDKWSLSRGGTTCSIIAVIGRTLYSANVGDSIGMICTQNDILQESMISYIGDIDNPAKTVLFDKTENVSFLLLTQDHSPDNPIEYSRIIESGKKNDEKLLSVYDQINIYKYLCDKVFDINSETSELTKKDGNKYYKNVRKEVATYITTWYDSGMYSGFGDKMYYPNAIATTRSLGDFYLVSCGLTYLPEIVSINLDEIFNKMRMNQEKKSSAESDISAASELDDIEKSSPDLQSICIVLGSDGLWDNWKFEHIKFFVHYPLCLQAIKDDPKNGANRVAKSLMSKNKDYAKKHFGNNTDNASGIVMYITEEK